eukprot:CAMPEP_0113672002 /NCGR_PEP_ID=MMETSP0038_2-20120614/6009_1 /TAXON_ID=2898 /ORGANISM="Cryptomonas paramecium" /LENGTH=39 /DNA_ID=CAMNT_0000588199 /DNA_START=498 /DNA_END=617 /DNA_ORIENTATION=- /assembly_acc=CAM_ASM_000170
MTMYAISNLLPRRKIPTIPITAVTKESAPKVTMPMAGAR